MIRRSLISAERKPTILNNPNKETRVTTGVNGLCFNICHGTRLCNFLNFLSFPFSVNSYWTKRKYLLGLIIISQCSVLKSLETYLLKVYSVTIGFALPSTIGKISVKRIRATKRSTYYNITNKRKEGWIKSAELQKQIWINSVLKFIC